MKTLRDRWRHRLVPLALVFLLAVPLVLAGHTHDRGTSRGVDHPSCATCALARHAVNLTPSLLAPLQLVVLESILAPEPRTLFTEIIRSPRVTRGPPSSLVPVA
jgi:hypothetical protein